MSVDDRGRRKITRHVQKGIEGTGEGSLPEGGGGGDSDPEEMLHGAGLHTSCDPANQRHDAYGLISPAEELEGILKGGHIRHSGVIDAQDFM